MLKSIIKILIDFLISLILFPINLIIISKEYNNIKKFEHVIIQTAGGFGHTFTMQDLARHLFGENFLYIFFIENTRHNLEVTKLFNNKSIILQNNISIKLFNKKITIGEAEGSHFRFIQSILLKIIYKINTKNIFKDHDIYNFSKEKYKNHVDYSFAESERWLGVYFHLKQNSTFKLNYNNLHSVLIKLNLSSLIQKFENSIKRNVCIYLRYRHHLKDISVTNRNGSPSKEYYDLINFLIKNKYNVFVTGDKVFSNKELSSFGENLIDCNKYNNKEERVLKTYLASISDTFISEAGGGQFFGMYSKKLLFINFFPPTRFYNNSKFLLKNVIDMEQNRTLNDNDKFKMFRDKTIVDKKYKILPNTSNQILEFIKNNL